MWHLGKHKPLHLDRVKIDRDELADLGVTQGPDGELMSFFDRTATPGGRARLLEMLYRPLESLDQIQNRQAAIAELEGVSRDVDLRAIASELGLAEAYAKSGILPLPTGALSLRLLDYRYPELTRDIIGKLIALRAVLRWAGDRRALWERFAALPALSVARSVLLLLDNPDAQLLMAIQDDSSRYRMGELDSRIREIGAPLTDTLTAVRELDALLSLAVAGDRPGFSVPMLRDTKAAEFSGTGIFHPLVPNAVPNDIRLGAESRLMYITGPNTAGKTTILRTCGVVVYLAHLGMRVPAVDARMSVYRRLSVQLVQRDSLKRGESLFLAEVRKVKKLIDGIKAGEVTFVAIDEPFRGTNLVDAEDAVTALIRGLAATSKCVCLVSSHLTGPPLRLKARDMVSLSYLEAKVTDQRITRDFKLQVGVSQQRLGMRLLQREGVLPALAELCPDLMDDSR